MTRVVVSHGQALLAVTDLSIMVQGDLRHPAELLANPEVRGHLDFGQPVAIGLFAILHFLRDFDDPAGTVACLRDAVAPGSYLAISHIGTDFFPDKSALAEAVAVYERASDRVWPRCRDQILSFFDGFELLEPGLVPSRTPARATATMSHRCGQDRHDVTSWRLIRGAGRAGRGRSGRI